jgi:5-methylcytosine-specific restriction endonuclease McrA
MKNCANCGEQFTPRVSGRAQVYCTPACGFIARYPGELAAKRNPVIQKSCDHCSAVFTTSIKAQHFCSSQCRYEDTKLRASIRWRTNNPLPDNWNYDCDECGVLVERALELGPRNKGAYGRFCAICTKKRKVARYRKKTVRRQGVVKPGNIHYLEVFHRDQGLCWLCNETVDPSLPRVSKLGGTIDHVIPISRGGEDTLENCRLAHWICNNRKSNKIIEEN